VKTSVSFAEDRCVNQRGLFWRLSKARVAWLRPRGVHRNSAQPSFSSRIGRMWAQASGFASAHSENTTPATEAPTRLL
jgi:hypothetical protein